MTTTSVKQCFGCGRRGDFVDSENKEVVDNDGKEKTLLTLYYSCPCGRRYGEVFEFLWHQGGMVKP